MLTITVTVDTPSWMAQGVKEYLAMTLERFGDTRVVAVHCTGPQQPEHQLEMEGGP